MSTTTSPTTPSAAKRPLVSLLRAPSDPRRRAIAALLLKKRGYQTSFDMKNQILNLAFGGQTTEFANPYDRYQDEQYQLLKKHMLPYAEASQKNHRRLKERSHMTRGLLIGGLAGGAAGGLIGHRAGGASFPGAALGAFSGGMIGANVGARTERKRKRKDFSAVDALVELDAKLTEFGVASLVPTLARARQANSPAGMRALAKKLFRPPPFGATEGKWHPTGEWRPAMVTRNMTSAELKARYSAKKQTPVSPDSALPQFQTIADYKAEQRLLRRDKQLQKKAEAERYRTTKRR